MKLTSAVVNLMKITGNSIIASNRIATYLSNRTGYPLVDQKKYCAHYDTLFIVNGPMLYCNFRAELQKMVKSAMRVVWVMNDYAIPAPRWVKDKLPIYWSSCDPLPSHERHVYTNWNQLTYYDDRAMKLPTYAGLCYYGAYRPDRKTYFKKYLGAESYQVYISTSKSGKPKFRALSPKAQFFTPTDLISSIADFEAHLYIEDRKSHDLYTSPANRFYECLSAHSPMLFDMSVAKTFERAGIDIRSWIIGGPEEIPSRLVSSGRLQKSQMKALRAVNYRRRLSDEVGAALAAIRASEYA